MVCLKCSRMLYDHKGRIGRRSALELEFAHHTKDSDLASSATVRPSCPLCYVVWTSTRVYDKKILAGTKVDGVRKFLRATLKCVRPRLDGHPERRALYRLDFHLEGVKDAVASFVLEETGGGSPANAGNDPDDLPQGPVDRPVIARGPETESTSSSSIQAKAKEWIEQCALNHEACASASGPAFYPTRLLDLREILKYRQDDGELPGDSDDLPPFRRSPTTPMGTILESRAKQQKLAESDESTRKVYVVSKKNLAGEQKLGPSPFKGPYVTLSHCWGKLELKKLTENTRQEWFQYGVPVLELPLTFQHAIQFACSLGVRWLWIDALCIIQDSKDKEDWLVESSQMREVYANSYCNISATAASDASEGLFYKRDTTISWVDTVNIRVNGLQGTVKDEQTGKAKKWVECTIHDLSFWRDTVENAPVNKRSWVFQERLLAPRVIHWCRDQIAFECREADKAECRPDGLPHYQIRADEIIEETRLKCLDVKTGKRLRNLRLRGKRSKSAPVGDKFYLYEIWKRLVETYSRMQLSYEGDRLVALSGIASMMTSVLKSHGIEDQYIAGMWRNHMAIQLLWYVNEGNGQTRQPFENTRPKAYRAPTFSWASVETERGITFPETTNNEELLVRVEIMRLTYKRNDNMFGLLTDGYVVLRGVLRKIDLIDKAASLRVFVSALKAVKFVDNWLTFQDQIS
jgi:Heterokaryon incompatibility protein (HET)